MAGMPLVPAAREVDSVTGILRRVVPAESKVPQLKAREQESRLLCGRLERLLPAIHTGIGEGGVSHTWPCCAARARCGSAAASDNAHDLSCRLHATTPSGPSHSCRPLPWTRASQRRGPSLLSLPQAFAKVHSRGAADLAHDRTLHVPHAPRLAGPERAARAPRCACLVAVASRAVAGFRGVPGEQDARDWRARPLALVGECVHAWVLDLEGRLDALNTDCIVLTDHWNAIECSRSKGSGSVCNA